MIEYQLRLLDNSVYELNDTTMKGKTTTSSEDSFNWSNEVITFDGRATGLQVGQPVISPKSSSFVRKHVGEDLSTENALIRALQNVAYLEDLTTLRRVAVVPSSYSISYPTGSHKLMGDVSFSLKWLSPFWEDISATTMAPESVVSGVEKDIALDIAGYEEVEPVITIVAASACTSLDLHCEETDDSFSLASSIFGTLGYTTLIIDCGAGTATVGVSDARADMVPGTAFIRLSSGVGTLTALANANLTVTISYRPRYYL